MLYNLAIVLSTACLVLAVLAALRLNRTYKTTRIFTPSRVLAVGVFFSGWFLFFPYYFESAFSIISFPARVWDSIWVSAHHTIRLFVIDTDFTEILEATSACGVEFYAVLGSVLFIFAPLMTFGVILSFFKNFSAYRRYLMRPKADTYVFSELNAKALTLARDIKNNHNSAIVIFADVFEQDNEESFEIVEQAKELGALCFKKDMLSLNLRFHSKKSKLLFFAIAEDSNLREVRRELSASGSATAEEENLKQVYGLATNKFYANRENTFVYVFSTGTQGELLISNLPENKLQIRRVDDIRSLVVRNLYEDGRQLFDHAVEEEDGVKCIRAFVVGTGGHGGEMIKALSWYCQLEGYRISIDAFDLDADAEERFAFGCPDLMSKENNGVYLDGEAQYKITFHTGLSVDSIAFNSAIASLPVPTYVFVSLGSDERNVRTAVALRRLFRQLHAPHDPVIHAIVYNSTSKHIFEDAKDPKGKPYGIHFVGDLEDLYSERVIINQELEQEALRTHMQYDGSTVDSFYRYEYNYRSSMASALHRELRIAMGLLDPNVPLEKMSEKEQARLETIEHRRWNAYMRSEGFVYSGSPDKSSRDDLAKMHHNLVPFEMLSEEDKRKDSRVAVKK